MVAVDPDGDAPAAQHAAGAGSDGHPPGVDEMDEMARPPAGEDGDDVRRLQDVLPLLAWFGSLAAGIVLFTQLGDGALATPALTDVDGWRAWFAGQDAVLAGVALLRLLVLALAWYLVGVTTIGLVARLLRLASLVRVADAISGPIVRHVLRQALGVSLAVGVVAASTGAAPRDVVERDVTGGAISAIAVDADRDAADDTWGQARTVTADREGDATTVQARAVSDGSVDDAATLRARPIVDDAPTIAAQALGEVEEERVTAVPLPPALADPARSSDDPTTTPVRDEVPEREHTVAPGEHLWSIAAQVVEEALERQPTDAEVSAYWQVLVEDNRERLANPDDPDLLFPDQVLRLPEVGGAAGA